MEGAIDTKRSSLKLAYEAGPILPHYDQIGDFEPGTDVTFGPAASNEDVMTLASVDPSLDIKNYSEDAAVA